MTRPDDAVWLCRVADVPVGGVNQVCPPGFDDCFAVYCLDGEFYLTDDMCTHAMAPLSEGEVKGGQILCPLHGGAFDIRTGAAVEYPCSVPLKTYSILREGDDLYGLLGSPPRRAGSAQSS